MEKLSKVEEQVLKDLCFPVSEREGRLLIPSATHVEPAVRQLPSIDSGVRPTEAPPDHGEELTCLGRLAGLGLISMTPIQGHPEGDMEITITEEGARALGKELVYPIEVNR